MDTKDFRQLHIPQVVIDEVKLFYSVTNIHSVSGH